MRAIARLACASAVALLSTPAAPTAQKGAPLPPSEPLVAWRVAGEGRGRPAVDGSAVFFLSKRHEVFAFDAASGARLWSQTTGEPGETTAGSTLVLAGPVVVAGDYNLAAFDRSTGALRWRFVPALGHAPGIYLGQSTASLVFAGSAAGRVYAVAAATGEQVWAVQVADAAASTVFSPSTDGRVVVAGYTVFGAPPTGGVVCLDPATGRELWRSPFARAPDPSLGTGSAGGALIAGDLVVASAGDGRVYGFDRSDGALLWTLPSIATIPAMLRGPLPLPPTLPGPDYRPLARSGLTLLVGSLKGDVVAYDLNTRRERWRYLDGSLGSVAFALTSDERSVYVPFASGRQVALAAGTGAERWRTPDSSDGFSWPSASLGTRVFMAGQRGGFVAFHQ